MFFKFDQKNKQKGTNCKCKLQILQCHFSLVTLQKDTFHIVILDQEKHVCNKTFFSFLTSYPQQAWPLLYSHLWHQYLAFTRPSSLWSSICFLAQVDTCPQVRTNFHIAFLNMWTILWIVTSSHADIFISMPSASYHVLYSGDGSILRYLCCGESDDGLCGGAAGSHSSGDELHFVCCSWVWGPEDWSGLSCSVPLRNYYGKTEKVRMLCNTWNIILFSIRLTYAHLKT